MKTVIILETDHLAIPVSELLNPKELKLVGIGNSYEETWNVFKDKESGELKDEIEGIPVMPIDLAISLQPDLVLIASLDHEKSNALKYMAIRAGFLNDMLFMDDFVEQFSLASSLIRKIARRLNNLGVAGNIAELGCYQGDISWQLNVLMPERKLYLFDTFVGYDERDIAREQQLHLSEAKVGTYKDVKVETLESRLPVRENVILKKGWFPETAFDIEDETFAFVYMDAGLYQPTFTGLEFFYPRLSQGGIILIHGYEDPKYNGIHKAVEDMEAKYGAFLMLPTGDLSGSIMIIRP